MEFVLLINIAVSSIHYCFHVMLHGIAFLWSDFSTFVKRCDQGFAPIWEYKRVQVFEKLVNSCIRRRIFLASALGIPTFQIMMCYISTKLFHSEHENNFKAVLFFWSYILALIFTVIIFSVAAKINNLSRNWLSRYRWRMERKLERKVLKSLAPLKLEFGNNFVDALTPLVVQEFCLRQTVSFLLVTM